MNAVEFLINGEQGNFPVVQETIFAQQLAVIKWHPAQLPGT